LNGFLGSGVHLQPGKSFTHLFDKLKGGLAFLGQHWELVPRSVYLAGFYTRNSSSEKVINENKVVEVGRRRGVCIDSNRILTWQKKEEVPFSLLAGEDTFKRQNHFKVMGLSDQFLRLPSVLRCPTLTIKQLLTKRSQNHIRSLREEKYAPSSSAFVSCILQRPAMALNSDVFPHPLGPVITLRNPVHHCMQR
ncbi:hypothetical protein MKW98_029687, partial [Papaver atlanticum]